MFGLLYADDLVLFDKTKEDLKVMVTRFVGACKKMDLNVNADNRKMMGLGRE